MRVQTMRDASHQTPPWGTGSEPFSKTALHGGEDVHPTQVTSPLFHFAACLKGTCPNTDGRLFAINAQACDLVRPTEANVWSEPNLTRASTCLRVSFRPSDARQVTARSPGLCFQQSPFLLAKNGKAKGTGCDHKDNQRHRQITKHSGPRIRRYEP